MEKGTPASNNSTSKKGIVTSNKPGLEMKPGTPFSSNSKSKKDVVKSNKPDSDKIPETPSSNNLKAKKRVVTSNNPNSKMQTVTLSRSNSTSKKDIVTSHKPNSEMKQRIPSSNNSKSKKGVVTSNKQNSKMKTGIPASNNSTAKKGIVTSNKPGLEMTPGTPSSSNSKSKKGVVTSNKPGSEMKPGTPFSNNSKSKKKGKSNLNVTVKDESQISITSSEKTRTKLRPSDIRYSQSSISSQFTDGTNIGQLLDDIYFGRCFASALPQIEVSQIKGYWVSADNRRLWVFKHLEKLGRVDFIIVKVTKRIFFGKLTSENAGVDVEIRNGSPSGVMFSSLYRDENKDLNKVSVTIEDGLAPKRSRRRNRRRQKPKTITEHDSNIETKTKESVSDTDIFANSEISAIETNTCMEDSVLELETLLEYNEDLREENTYFEELSYSDSDDSTENDLSDIALFDYHVLPYTSPNGYSELWENHLNDSETETDGAFSKLDSKPGRTFDEVVLANFPEFSEETKGQEKTLNLVDHNYSTYDFGNEIDFPMETYQNEPDVTFQRGSYSDYCDQFDCVRCTRMRFYRELDIGYYYEPRYCQPHVTGNRSVKKQVEHKSMLEQVSRGIQIIKGIFNKIFD